MLRTLQLHPTTSGASYVFATCHGVPAGHPDGGLSYITGALELPATGGVRYTTGTVLAVKGMKVKEATGMDNSEDRKDEEPGMPPA